MKVFFSHEAYRFHEDRDDAFVIVVAEAAAGMPRAATVDVSVRSRRGTARSPNDYEALSASITLPEEDFALENGSWQLQYQLPVTLVDDEIREGTESFDLVMERALAWALPAGRGALRQAIPSGEGSGRVLGRDFLVKAGYTASRVPNCGHIVLSHR